MKWLAAAGAALMLAGDIVLTVVLTYLFYTSRTGGKRYISLPAVTNRPSSLSLPNSSDSMLDILMKYTVGTGTRILRIHGERNSLAIQVY